MGRITETVKVLLITNILFYLGSNFLAQGTYQLFSLHYFDNPNFGIWQLFTHMFMHSPITQPGGIMHIFINMFMLYMFGSHLENSIGKQKFIFLYLSAGLGAAGLQLLYHYYNFQTGYQTYLAAGASPKEIEEVIKMAVETGRFYVINGVSTDVTNAMLGSYMTTMVGASGAVFGVLAAFAVLFPNLPLYLFFIPIPIKAKYLIGAYFLIDLYSGISGNNVIGPSNVAHWAHVGGAVIGFIMMWYWKKNSFNKNRWDL